MGDLTWGFAKNYGHRTLPFKWQSSSGYNVYQASPLKQTCFRPDTMPVYREDVARRALECLERRQDERWNMSSYGVHREFSWDHSLRGPATPRPKPLPQSGSMRRSRSII